MAAQQAYHVMIDRDDSGNPVFNLTKPSSILDMIIDAGHMAHWSFPCSLGPGTEFIVHVYKSGPDIPTGENLEELNRRAAACVLRDG